MSTVALTAALALALPGEVSHVDASLVIDGRLLASRVEDIDGDGRNELTVALHDRGQQRRELHVYRFTAAGDREPVPFLELAVPDDVVAWCWADVRDEPGRELAFLARSGVWSYSTTHDGFRGNITRQITADLLLDVPDPHSLPHWDYVLAAPGGDQLLLPIVGGYSIWAPTAARDVSGAPVFEQHSEFQAAVNRVQTRQGDRDGGSVSLSPDGLAIDARLEDAALVELHPPTVRSWLVETRNRVRAPALVDVDGDGLLDLLRLGQDALHVHLADEHGIAPDTTRSEPLPAYIDQGDRTFHLHDLDGDGDVDVLLHLVEEGDGLLDDDDVQRFLVLRNDGRLLPERPHQLFKFEASRMRPQVTDVNGDGDVDLVFSRLRAGGLLQAAGPGGFHLERDVLVFFGSGGARFERRPGLEHGERFDESRLAQAITRRRMELDCDGDGLADLVDVDLEGHVIIRRVEHESSFFGGESWELSPTPWRRLPVAASLRDFEVQDINGDGVGDVISRADERLVLLLSRGRSPR